MRAKSDIAAISTSLARLSILFGLSNPSLPDSLKYNLQLIIPLHGIKLHSDTTLIDRAASVAIQNTVYETRDVGC